MLILLFFLGVILSIAFNMVVIIVVLRKKRHTNHLDLLKLSLAISDISQAAIGYIVELHAFWNKSEITKTSCIIAAFSTTFLGLVSINHLVGLSIERCIFLSFPWKGRLWFNNKWIALYVIIPSWIYGLLWALMPLLGWSSYQRENGAKYRCSINMMHLNSNAISYAYCILTFCFFIPIIGISTSSFITLRHLKVMRRTGDALGVDAVEKNLRGRRETKHACMVFALIITFLIAWSPYAACIFVMTVKGTVNDKLLTYSAFFAKSSTLYNPIIYFVFMDDFRRRCLVIFCCRRMRRMSETTSVYVNPNMYTDQKWKIEKSDTQL